MEMNLEDIIKQVVDAPRGCMKALWKCWRAGWSELEIDWEARIESVWRCAWRQAISEIGDGLGPNGSWSFNMLDTMIK